MPYLRGLSRRETEFVLADHLRAAGVPLEREVELVDFAQDEEGADATLRRADGAEEGVRARWLLGCDGARSTVRGGLGLAFEGSIFEQTVWQADIRVRFPFDVDANEASGFPSENGMMGALPLLAEGRYRLIAFAPPNRDDEPTLEGMRAIARQRLPEGTELDDPAWLASLRFHGRLAERYRVGRVFLSGDAAHIHSPVGGQGMNLGIRDAYNLACKLALVVKGAAHERVLDSYEPERRRIAEGVVTGTGRVTPTRMRALSLRHPLATRLRGRPVSFVTELGMVQARLGPLLGGIRVGYPDRPLVGEHHRSLFTAELGARHDERPRLAGWMRFSDGPGPGARVPDTDLPEGAAAATLPELLLGTPHLLLLFDGAAATSEGYANLDAIAERVERRYGAHVVTHVVVPRAERPRSCPSAAR